MMNPMTSTTHRPVKAWTSTAAAALAALAIPFLALALAAPASLAAQDQEPAAQDTSAQAAPAPITPDDYGQWGTALRYLTDAAGAASVFSPTVASALSSAGFEQPAPSASARMKVPTWVARARFIS